MARSASRCSRACFCVPDAAASWSDASAWKLTGVASARMASVTELIQPQQRSAGVNLGVDRGKDLSHLAGLRSPHRGFHLHAFEHGQCRSRGDIVADLDVQSDHNCWRGRAHECCLVRRDPVTDALDVHEVIAGSGHRRHDVEGCSAEHEPTLEGVQAVHGDVDEPPVHLESVPAGGDLGDDQVILQRLVAELDRAADDVAGSWPATAGGVEELAALERRLSVVHADRDADESNVAVTTGGDRRDAEPVQPARVCFAGHELGMVEQVEQESTCWSSRPRRQAWSRGGHSAAGLGPPIGPGPRPRPWRVPGRGQPQSGHRERSRSPRECRDRPAGSPVQRCLAGEQAARIGVLSIEMNLDCVPDLLRCFPRQALAVGDEQLQA